MLPQTKVFLAVSFPIVIDTVGNLFDLWNTTNEIRFVLGFIWGVILPFYFIAGLADALLRKTRQQKSEDSNFS
jgi:hypothetical protein